LKSKILDGSISIEETRQLYDACKTVGNDKEKRIAIGGVIEDLENSGITHEKYHDFNSKLVKVEAQVVSENPRIDPSQPETKQKDAMKKRCAEYMRNTSLAKNVMLHECTKNGLGYDIYKDLKENNIEAATKKFQEFNVPDYLQDHYSTIGEFYKENGNAQGAATNLAFHALTTSINEYAKIELTGNERNNIIRTSGKTYKSVYDPTIEGSRDRLMDQIPGKRVTVDFSNITPPDLKPSAPSVEEVVPPQQKPKTTNIGEKIANAFKGFKEKIQNFGKAVKDFVTSAFKKSDKTTTDLPEATKPETKKVGPDKTAQKEKNVSLSRPRANALTSETAPSIKAAAENVRKNVSTGKQTGSAAKGAPRTAISANKKQDQNKGASR
ncbi:MAG: hypothetical protein AAF673_03120, partial [Pseudomonadota bacterium]